MGGAEAAPTWGIDAMREGDIDAVAAVERRSYRSPWGRDVLVGELFRELARVDVVRERGAEEERIVAFCNYWLVHDEIHLLSIATDPDRQGRGYGRRLLDHLIAKGERGRFRRITLEVRRSNARALDLYRDCGFYETGVRRAYYADGEDAIVMLRDLERSEDAL